MFTSISQNTSINLSNVNYIEMLNETDALYHFLDGSQVRGRYVNPLPDTEVSFLPPPEDVSFLTIEKIDGKFRTTREVLTAIRIEYGSDFNDIVGVSLSGSATNQWSHNRWFVLEHKGGYIYADGIFDNLDAFLATIS